MMDRLRMAAADADDRLSLPAWVYRDPDFYALELDRVFRPAWQIVCHVADIPEAGDYHGFAYLGEPLVVVRGRDGVVRGFYNVCRHRAARILDGERGNCGSRMVCPYHAWTYDLDGRLTGLPFRRSFAMDTADHGLAPIEVEIYQGFVFIRLEPGLPSVAEMMAPYTAELAAYRPEEMRPIGRVTMRARAVNWKNVGDNYSDGLHITVAHPGLTRLFGRGYQVESRGWADKMWAGLRDDPSDNLSERAYQKYLPDVPQLPADRQRLWTYFKLWPNMAFDVYPDQIDFMQWLPVSPTECLIREIPYAHPDARREMRAARYLNWRINRRVSVEDKALIERVQAGMASRSYTTGPLGDGEVSLKAFAARIRCLIPESHQHRPPPPGWRLTSRPAPALAAE
jgi:phenylpropionate dioxygenase-like ring-hydroxylating dioxygenase large terminal subunit